MKTKSAPRSVVAASQSVMGLFLSTAFSAIHKVALLLSRKIVLMPVMTMGQVKGCLPYSSPLRNHSGW